MSLELETRTDFAVIRLTPHGLEAMVSPLSAWMASGPAQKTLRLDFASVQILTAASLGKLVMLRHAARASGGRLILVNLGPSLYEIFDVTHLTRLFEIWRSVGANLVVADNDHTSEVNSFGVPIGSIDFFGNSKMTAW